MLFNPNLCTGCQGCGCGRCDLWLTPAWGWAVVALDVSSFFLPVSLSHGRYGGSHCGSPPGPVHHQGEWNQCKQGEPCQRHCSCHCMQEVQATHTGKKGKVKWDTAAVHICFYKKIRLKSYNTYNNNWINWGVAWNWKMNLGSKEQSLKKIQIIFCNYVCLGLTL